jgi:hypothetical protein
MGRIEQIDVEWMGTERSRLTIAQNGRETSPRLVRPGAETIADRLRQPRQLHLSFDVGNDFTSELYAVTFSQNEASL